MRVGILVFISLVVSMFAAPDTSRYDEKFNLLSQKRVGLSDKEIISLRNPFSPAKDKVIEEEVAPDELIGKELTAIIGDRVRINNEWYSLGDNMGSFKILSLIEDGVLLENQNGKLELKLKKGNKNVTIKY